MVMIKVLAPILVLFLLSGCAAWVPMALSAAGGAVTFAKDVVGLDTALMQNTPGKIPISNVIPSIGTGQSTAPVILSPESSTSNVLTSTFVPLTMKPVPNP